MDHEHKIVVWWFERCLEAFFHSAPGIAMTNPVKLVANPIMLFTLLFGETVTIYSHSPLPTGPTAGCPGAFEFMSKNVRDQFRFQNVPN